MMAHQIIAGKICDEYKEKDNRIYVIHKENAGLSAARNSGSKIAKGEWITFVDGDDWIEYNTCEIIYEYIQDKELDVALFGAIRNNEKKEQKLIYNFKETTFFDKKACEKMQIKILDFNSKLSSQWGKFYRKKFIEKNNLYNIESLKQGAEGIEFNIRVFEVANRAVFINEFLYHYRYNENSISSCSTDENNFLILDCFRQIKKTLQKKENYKEILPFYYNRLLYVIVTTAISGYFNPNNTEKYKVKKAKLKKYMEQDIIVETLKNTTYKKLDMRRKIIMIFLKIKAYKMISIMAYFRYKSKL